MNEFRGSCVLQSKYGSDCAGKEDPARHERFHVAMKGNTGSTDRAVFPKIDCGTPIERHPRNFRVAVGSVMPQPVAHTRKGDLHALR
jgi:hypothetical protein